MTERPSHRWDTADYAASGAFVPALGMPVIELLAPRAGERVLDLGCGDGTLTRAVVDAGAVVTALDASPEMVAAAREKGVDAHVADARALAFDAAFDAVMTNAVLHWINPPEAVAAGVFRALTPGGRYVGELGGAGNVETLELTLADVLSERGVSPTREGQWYPDSDTFIALHRAAGFADIETWRIERPTPLPAGAAGWYRTFRRGLIERAVPAADRDAVIAKAGARADAALPHRDGHVLADYVRLRFMMRKPH